MLSINVDFTLWFYLSKFNIDVCWPATNIITHLDYQDQGNVETRTSNKKRTKKYKKSIMDKEKSAEWKTYNQIVCNEKVNKKYSVVEQVCSYFLDVKGKFIAGDLSYETTVCYIKIVKIRDLFYTCS